MTAGAAKDIGVASAWFERHRPRLVAAGAAGRFLDVACGRGRHALAAAHAGLDVLAIDRNEDALDELATAAAALGLSERIETRSIDLEGPSPPTLDGERFGVVCVARYLHRPLSPWLVQRLAPSGLLLYETFTTDQRALGWGPSRDAFLLEPGELPGLFPALAILDAEEGPSGDAKPAATARLLARAVPATESGSPGD